ncbi:MAG: cell wall metabolism sensor histidine kinase WalK [Defluviitaleaceae bacterium]|nr:cell wall metabolism sensor histidine kinase WalK [Defluviitaleaceae bacterium]
MSIRWKLVIIYIALVFVVMMTSGTIIILSLRWDEEATVARELSDAADYIRESVIRAAFLVPDVNLADRLAFEGLFTERFRGIAGRLPQGTQAFIISGADWRTLESSEHPMIGEFETFTASVVISAKSGYSRFDAGRTRTSAVEGAISWFEYASPVFLPEFGESPMPDYIIYVRKRADDFQARIAATTRTIGLASIIAILGASVLGGLFTNSLSSQILLLNRKMKDFAAGKLNEPIEIKARDEISQLADSFNVMAVDIDNSITEITNEKNKNEIILHNMTDGVLAYNNSGGLIHSNYVAEEMLGIEDLARLSIHEMLSRLGIEADPGEGVAGIEILQDVSISIGEKYINAGFNAYKNTEGHIEGVIIVFQDITKHMKLDNMRKEFVANVSHEIRTPLTTVKTYTETLIDTIEEDGHADSKLLINFLNTINGEADRMTSIVNDLLELSQYDSRQMEFAMVQADLVGLIEANARKHSVAAQRQGKEVTFYATMPRAPVLVDPNRINQVFNNIISNSLRYSEAGARIEIEIHAARASYLVYVTDTGIGIPKEDLRNIFERFYRVDKARSRELGGTGLGLPIAKEIMEGHGGKISASSELGKGTTMMLRFPKPSE